MRSKVFVTYAIPEAPMAKLYEKCQVIVNPFERILAKEELCEYVKDVEAIISMVGDHIDKDVIDASPNLKVIANFGVGFNNIDYKYAASKGIAVSNTPDVLTNATADLAWALLFSVARRIIEADEFIRQGKFKGWTPKMFSGQDITGKTLGVIGAGRIGSNFAKKAKAFDMRILYYNRKPNMEFEAETGAQYVDKETLLRESDFVSIHAPLTEETKHIVSYNEFEIMKRNAIIINTARGPLIDEKALVDALKKGYIWAAGLDVFENEPLVEKELLTMKNVVITPHIGSSTIQTRERMSAMVAENALAALEGKRPPTCVNL